MRRGIGAYPGSPQSRLVFFSVCSPIPPWICCFCQEDIWKKTGRDSDSLVVHHENGDRTDDRPQNLYAAHFGCHARWHNLPRRESDEQTDETTGDPAL